MRRFSPDPDNRHVGMEEDSLGSYIRVEDHLKLIRDLHSLLDEWQEEAGFTSLCEGIMYCHEGLINRLKEETNG